MISNDNSAPDSTRMILVVEDVRETRDGIEKLLQSDGYRVALAEGERDAIDSASRNYPDLILVSLGGPTEEVVRKARRIREYAATGDQIPVVVFCIEDLAEGEEVAIDPRIYVTSPDNFNQLRRLLARLLNESSSSKDLKSTTIVTELNQ
ncbi:MAG TPA: response regulator [Pyrinomonadaceae bacterium]|nr:response regulator [Pyrinomonadaceae bacterium]